MGSRSGGAGLFGLSPGLFGQYAAMRQGGFFQVSINDVCKHGLVFPIAVPHEVFAHPCHKLWLEAAAGAIDFLEADAIPTTANVPVILEVAV